MLQSRRSPAPVPAFTSDLWYMAFPPIIRSLVASVPLASAFAVALAVACADGAQGARTANPSFTRGGGAVNDTVPHAPAIVVDSITALRRGTVMDTMPLPAARSRPKTARSAADSSTSRDTTQRKPVSGMIGPRAGDRHLAFRGTGAGTDSLWPVRGPEPLAGSILPAHRIVAFYGNPLSKRMGILGELPPEVMLRKLDAEVAAWNRADSTHPVQPALHLIVLVADAVPGTSGKYRTRMDSAMIEKVYGWARSRRALLFVDLQVGQSTLQYELPWIEKFLVRPDVHLGIDPEFSMKKGGIPGRRVGTYDAADINFASRYLANLVDRHKLPPKILVVHRFTPGGVTNLRRITLDPRVQIVMDMDGFGPPWMKRDTYWRDIKRVPVQFTGWKQFTKAKNDRPPTSREEILRLWPVPLYIQVQ
jgi:hypothetical protein